MSPSQNRYYEIVQEIATKENLPQEIVDKAYRGFWKFVRHTIAALPLKQNLSEDEFKRLRTNINIPSLGKITCDYDRYVRVRKHFEHIHIIKNYDSEENQADV